MSYEQELIYKIVKTVDDNDKNNAGIYMTLKDLFGTVFPNKTKEDFQKFINHFIHIGKECYLEYEAPADSDFGLFTPDVDELFDNIQAIDGYKLTFKGNQFLMIESKISSQYAFTTRKEYEDFLENQIKRKRDALEAYVRERFHAGNFDEPEDEFVEKAMGIQDKIIKEGYDPKKQSPENPDAFNKKMFMLYNYINIHSNFQGDQIGFKRCINMMNQLFQQVGLNETSISINENDENHIMLRSKDIIIANGKQQEIGNGEIVNDDTVQTHNQFQNRKNKHVK